MVSDQTLGRAVRPDGAADHRQGYNPCFVLMGNIISPDGATETL